MTTGSDHWPGRVRAAFADDFTDEQAVLDEGFGPLTRHVPADRGPRRSSSPVTSSG